MYIHRREPSVASVAPPTAAPSTGASSESAERVGGPGRPAGAREVGHEGGPSGEWSASNIHAVIANYMNLDEKYGLEIEFVNFAGGSQVVQAALAGQVDVSDNSGGPVVASLATDTPLVMTFITRSNLTDNMYTAAKVKSGADLKGKTVAISSFGSQSHAGALLAIKSLGLTTDDVTITQVGNDSARLAALQGGSVAASMNDATQDHDLSGLGFNILVKLAEEEGLGGVPRTSMTVTQAYAEANPNTILELTAMYYEANLDVAGPRGHRRRSTDCHGQGRCRRAEERYRLCLDREAGNRSTAAAIRRSWSSRSRPCSRQIRTCRRSMQQGMHERVPRQLTQLGWKLRPGLKGRWRPRRPLLTNGPASSPGSRAVSRPAARPYWPRMSPMIAAPPMTAIGWSLPVRPARMPAPTRASCQAWRPARRARREQLDAGRGHQAGARQGQPAHQPVDARLRQSRPEVARQRQHEQRRQDRRQQGERGAPASP